MSGRFRILSAVARVGESSVSAEQVVRVDTVATVPLATPKIWRAFNGLVRFNRWEEMVSPQSIGNGFPLSNSFFYAEL